MRGTSHHIGSVAVGLFLICAPAVAGEFAVLSNGFRLHADRHEMADGRVRLFEGSGVTELPASEITAFEQEEYTPPAPAAPVQSAAPPVQPAQDLFEAAAKKHGLPPALVRSVVKAESNFRADAVSPKGAIGLMQLMPGTARELGADPKVPEQNVDAGTKYLRDLLGKYEDKDDQVARAIAAYNAGSGAVDKYNGVPPYNETQVYVRRVLQTYDKLKAAPVAAGAATDAASITAAKP